MSHTVDIWGPCPPSNSPPVGGNPQGISTTGGSVSTYRNQIKAPWDTFNMSSGNIIRDRFVRINLPPIVNID